MMLFLLFFVLVVYSLIYIIILEDQKRELSELTRQESRIIRHYLAENTIKELHGLEKQPIVLAGVDQFFYYVVDEKGQLIMGQEMIPEARSALLELLQGWIPRKNDIREESLTFSFPERSELDEGPSRERSTKEVKLLIDGMPLFHKGEFIGILYIGKDITFAYQLFRWLLIILIGLAVLFLGVALVISRHMAKKAMIPISEAFARQREFVGDASHELRTPLSVMLSSINALEMVDCVDEDPFTRKLIVNMKNEVKRMTKLVSDLLVMARADSGVIERNSEMFDFQPLAEEVYESVSPLAHEKRIHLRTFFSSSLFVNGDRERLAQLLYILLDNAMKYTSSEGTVDLAVSNEGKKLIIRVQDTGIGIDPSEHSRIFDRFYRSDKSRSRAKGGYGLGLSIAKWIVDSHGGTIEIESALGQGSVFTISLPIVQPS
ncbi:two-component sensor histidine kinase [Bacillaceae bacterium SAOS 7]|nr:two-component sensor histidine kinase [Bacillaceae bacterium SAOS 7]